MENKANKSIPDQHSGSEMDVIEERILPDLTASKHLFKEAYHRMLSVNSWGDYSHGTKFTLFDAEHKPAKREARSGDFIRIDIPGPGPISGDGFDWVHVESVEFTEDNSNAECIAMQVRPCQNPFGQKADVAHFLKKEATSTFVVRRNGLHVCAEEHGRNEMANISSEKILDDARNFIVGIAAKLGFSYPQWKMLVKGLLDGKN